ncbi:MAG: hypothetical protein JXN61_04040 [Sedimentisphaerales bacterium]|nr:hypothetical protein [Sedimentisphaerales bacterium]
MYGEHSTRREFLRQTAFGALTLAALREAPAPAANDLPKIRAITRGPKYHWFAYYDKLQFDPTGRYALGMEVDFEHRSPMAEDVIKIGMVDLKDEDHWTELGQTNAWCWQQGCMLQWRPGSNDEILWNDRRDDQFISHILNVRTKTKRTLSFPFYTISPDGRTAVAPDFRRIQDMRPGYGYPGLPDPYKDQLAPKDSGIFRIDLETGKRDLIISIEEITKLGKIPGDPKNAKHYFNHLLFNTDGSRFIFLHRWIDEGRRRTRMLTARPDGSQINIVDDSGYTSHFIWRDPDHILAWSRHPSNGSAFYLFTDGTKDVEVVGKDVMTVDGHCSYLPDKRWILNDGYPSKQRNQNVYLYDTRTGKRILLGAFPSPPQYTGEWRCDTHPRFSPDGKSVVIDSPHTGTGRQMHLIDISKIVG